MVYVFIEGLPRFSMYHFFISVFYYSSFGSINRLALKNRIIDTSYDVLTIIFIRIQLLSYSLSYVFTILFSLYHLYLS